MTPGTAPLPWRLLARPGIAAAVPVGLTIAGALAFPVLVGGGDEFFAWMGGGCLLLWRVAAGALAGWIGLAAAVYRARTSPGQALGLAALAGATVVAGFDLLLGLALNVGHALAQGQNPAEAAAGAVVEAPGVAQLLIGEPLFAGSLALTAALPPLLVLVCTGQGARGHPPSRAWRALPWIALARPLSWTAFAVVTDGFRGYIAVAVVVGALETIPFVAGVALVLAYGRPLREALAARPPPDESALPSGT